MNMSFVFWIVTVTMAVVALSFLVMPIVLKNRKLTATTWVIAIAVPAVAIGLYVALGRPDALSSSSPHQDAIPTSTPNAGVSAGNLSSVDSLLSGLEEKLAADPSDAKGWLLLAKSYSHLGRNDDAAVAYAKAKGLGQFDSEFEAKLDGATAPVDVTPTVRGRLTIADAAKKGLDPQDSVFIFAKSTDGSALPVAVLRKVASDLPFDFELSDKQSMSTEAKLSNASAVIITARVSKSGNAMQAEPGLEVVSQPIIVGEDLLVELHLGGPSSSDET